ncbi:hypothetical protein [Paenibacillus silvisoli]|uniref:hypothetical protein n=1 Tax=Paenibacillus silvisoli TaxID=3110539 RepID=UPI002804B11F|nr:hypothetical protein [Paenibacillus silvisoli]
MLHIHDFQQIWRSAILGKINVQERKAIAAARLSAQANEAVRRVDVMAEKKVRLTFRIVTVSLLLVLVAGSFFEMNCFLNY